MNRNTAQNSIRPWAVLFWLLVWQGASMLFAALWPHGHLLLVSPVSAALRLGELACTAAFWRAVGGSIAHIFGGFLVGCALAVALAALSARWRLVRELLYPLTAAVKAVPVVSFIILALVWLDSRSLPLFISALMVFPPVYLNVLAGIAAADAKLLEMARVFRVPWLRQARCILLPAAEPFLLAGSAAALGMSWKAGVAAEVIGVVGGSIGEKLYEAKIYLQTGDLLAWTAVIVALSALFERAVLALLRRCCRWAKGGRT